MYEKIRMKKLIITHLSIYVSYKWYPFKCIYDYHMSFFLIKFR